MITEPSPEAWSAYWEGTGHRRIFAVEARDHVERLRTALPLRPTDRVLDFGCGFGHVVEQLSPSVARVGYWDASAVMRHATAARTAALASVEPVDLGGPIPVDALGAYNFVLVNSVIQYMARAELAEWLLCWRSLLAPGGRVVVSDIPVPGRSVLAELTGMLVFAARHGFLLRAVRDGVEEVRRYARSRARADLLRWTPDDFTALAAGCGLVATVLAANLTHRSGRFSVLLQPAQPELSSLS